MTSHTSRLRATSTVTAVATALVLGAAPAAVAQSPPVTVRAPSPSPDPFKGQTADQIADKAVTATQSATSLRMAGRVVSSDQPLDVDFSLNDKNECTGAIKLKGGAAEIRQTGRVTYMKGDEAFWRASMSAQRMPEAQIDATIELLKGRWLKIPQGQPGAEDLSDVCDLKALLDDLGKDKERRTGLTRGPDAEVDDTPVATLVKKKTDADTTEPGDTAEPRDPGDPTEPRDTPETTTVSVSQRGKPYILKVVKTGGDEPGSVTLSEYDKPVKVAVPPAGETVDLTKLDRGTPA
ncbi:hypothetical protein ACFY7C_22420 [Streptomyces sp. NPDC012769]|uniref:hypothetical protein n=1 Tax=Streptomyces sp. NPDC012769 TaxID=3364848 RepID=UPI0036B7C3CE